MRHVSFLACSIAALACGALAMNPEPDAEAGSRRRAPTTARAVVRAMNKLVPSDIGISPAVSSACDADRLPAKFADLLPLVPQEHRRLLEECAGGRMRVQRGLATFEPLALLDEAIDAGDRAAPIRAFFSGRPVDVASGTGLSEGPYPISFDWAVVLDRRSQTLFSFVFNCRD